MVGILSLCLVLSFADSLYADGDYARAITEYKRLLFAQDVDTSYAFYRIGMSYKKSERHRESVPYFRAALAVPAPGSSDEEISLELAGAYLRTLQYRLARQELTGSENPMARRLHAVSYLLEGEFREAARSLDESSDPGGELRAVAREGAELKPLDENRMAILSALLPGCGQVLAGSPKEGVLSFLLTASSGFFLYDAVKDRRYLDASLIFSQVFWRFYLGSIRRAHSLTTEENSRRMRAVLERSELVREYLD